MTQKAKVSSFFFFRPTLLHDHAASRLVKKQNCSEYLCLFAGTTVMNNTTKELKSARLPALSVPGGELSTVTITRSISSYEESDAAGAGGVGMIGMTSWHDNDEGAMSSPEF